MVLFFHMGNGNKLAMLSQHPAYKQHQTSRRVFTQRDIGPQRDGDGLFPQAEALHMYPCFPRRPYRWKGWGHRTTARLTERV